MNSPDCTPSNDRCAHEPHHTELKNACSTMGHTVSQKKRTLHTELENLGSSCKRFLLGGLQHPTTVGGCLFVGLLLIVVGFGIAEVSTVTSSLEAGSNAYQEFLTVGNSRVELSIRLQDFRVVFIVSVFCGYLVLLACIRRSLSKWFPSKYSALSSSRQKTLASHVLRGLVQAIIFFATVHTVVKVHMTGNSGLASTDVRTMVLIALVPYLPLYITELAYRDEYSIVMAVHHVVGIMATAPIVDSEQYIPGFPDYYYIHFMMVEAVFANAEFIVPVALVGHYLLEDQKEIARLLHWVKLAESAMKIILNVGLIAFYAVYFSFFSVASAVVIPVIIVLTVPAQMYVPYVLQALENKALSKIPTSDGNDKDVNIFEAVRVSEI